MKTKTRTKRNGDALMYFKDAGYSMKEPVACPSERFRALTVRISEAFFHGIEKITE